MFDYTQEAAYEIAGLKRQVQELKEEVEDKKTKIIKRDQANGAMLAENHDLQEEIDDLRKQLVEKATQHDDKAMLALDVKKQVNSLAQSNKDLEAEVGRLSMKASVTWQDGLVKFLTEMVDKRIAQASNEMDYWDHCDD